MNHNPAGAGRDTRPEFITEESITDSRIVNQEGQWKALLMTRQALEDIVLRVHNTYHAKGVAKPPWHQCHRTVCRLAKAVLEELDEGGYG